MAVAAPRSPPSLTATSTHRLTLGLAVTAAAAASLRAVSMRRRGDLLGDCRWRHSGQMDVVTGSGRQAATGAGRRRRLGRRGPSHSPLPAGRRPPQAPGCGAWLEASRWGDAELGTTRG